jgi:hypothetical protein
MESFACEWDGQRGGGKGGMEAGERWHSVVGTREAGEALGLERKSVYGIERTHHEAIHAIHASHEILDEFHPPKNFAMVYQVPPLSLGGNWDAHKRWCLFSRLCSLSGWHLFGTCCHLFSLLSLFLPRACCLAPPPLVGVAWRVA